MAEIVLIMEYLHYKGIAHRDLKVTTVQSLFYSLKICLSLRKGISKSLILEHALFMTNLY